MRRAVLSVYDKTGLLELAQGLHAQGFELCASGGSAAALVRAGLPVTPIEAVTGAPEMLGGRVKTLHPAIAGGLLARRTPEHLAELAARGLTPIDVLVCNLYPFRSTVAQPGVTEAEAIEQIDIGGVTLLRAAAKNFESVCVVCDPADYSSLLEGLAAGGPDLAARRALALKAFRHTAAYDAAIATWLGAQVEGEALPETMNLAIRKVQTLRYGENPHQSAALYVPEGQSFPFEQLQGKELSYNNLVDLDAARAMPLEFDAPCVAIIKHTNPCGLALGDTLTRAYERALACDPVSAFGSIIATNGTVDASFVGALGSLFVEVLVAPDFTDEALARLAKRKNCRVMRSRILPGSGRTIRGIYGGFLVQDEDRGGVDPASWRVVTERAPSDAERAELAFAWLACKHVKSNAIVFAKDRATVGVGAGQMNRVDSVRLAAARAGERAAGAVVGSDAFFPFPDGVLEAANAGVTAIVQPGGSIRDDEVIAAANARGLAMVFTGERHFRH